MKFPYLKKDEYEVWAMKMEYWITNNDMNIWKVLQNGNSLKRTGRDHDEGVIILPSTTAEELKARFGENKESKKMRMSMLKQEFLEFRIGEAEGLHKGYDRMQKILSQLNQLKAKTEDEDINLKFLRALPSSWSQVALTLKTKGGLEFLSFDDLYYKLKTLEVGVKGYTTFSLSQSAGPSHSAFVSATSASKKMSYGDSLSYSSNTTYPASLNSKTGPHISSNVLGDVPQSFKARRKIDFDKKESARFNKKKVRCYKCQQRGHFARECRAKEGNDKQRYSSFKIKEIRKKEEDLKALITVDTLVDWTDHDDESAKVITPKEFGMIAGCDFEDAIKEGVAKMYNLITGANSEGANTTGDAGEFALMGVTSELTLEDKIRVLSIELENTSNLLKHSDRINADFETAKKDLQTKLDNHLVCQTDSMKVVPPPLSGDYTSLSDHIDLDESQMSYGTKSLTSYDSKSMSNDFVSCEDSDKSSEVNTNDFASSDSTVKSLEHQPNDYTLCASTSSVSTSEHEAKIESNVRTPIKEPIIL
nr:hypothetical protein [Tanacetum cinerariifolium]